MAQFSQYAVAATDEALEDAGWKPASHEDREATVGFISSVPDHDHHDALVLIGD